MSDLSDLYQEILLQHNSKPRNFRKLDDANRTADGYNPLCGDIVHLFLKVDDGVITDVGFQGSGCAISRASASMLTESVKGQSLGKASELFDDLESLAGVSEFPTRIKCAVLAWHTLCAALDGQSDAVTTE